MRYHYEKPEFYTSMYGETYECVNPIYKKCTLYKIDDGRGIAVIQQHYDPETKHTWWGEIDPWLTDDIYLHPEFKVFLYSNSKKPKKGVYPTIPVRQLMWMFRMKPMKRQPWETTFDKQFIF